ncbi:hypothetical protein [Bradyrhizobium sp. AUGA SZCCT0042]|uniref:hypothetical protein n=1 Tax=Bradyrhizobium sp. AUGA SZCCT0042 TaxID=2807651 RepID=UPI001BA9BB57|nr:hypothetical protein [Bradyrhizobium sp. AUGA SZCCT0042]MBR1298548.1 hypothetical protein [Bradyrhizobium sp. AUGA SZCCT0042]
MALVFRSTTSEMVQIVVRDSDGSQRVATLERDPYNPRRWRGSVDHPSGARYSVDTFDPDAIAALGKLSDALVSRESDYAQSKGRGHRREPSMRDANVRVDDIGNDVNATVKGYER